MKISTRTRYGIRAMLELAKLYPTGPLQLKIIAKRQDISLKYLEQQMALLKSAGFIRSVRGSKGGYILNKAPGEITLNDIFTCLESQVVTAECVQDKQLCSRSTDCIVRGVWQELQQAIENVLESITLEDLVKKAQKSNGLDYQI